MTMNSSGAISLAGSTAGQSIAVELGQGATSQISLNDAAVRSLAGIASGAITMPTNFWGKSNITGTQKGIFGFGGNPSQYSQVNYNITNLVSNTGVVAGNGTGVGTARYGLAACGYGTDKGIFGYGKYYNAQGGLAYWSMTNKVSNTGVVSGDTAGVGTARGDLGACGYGGDKGIFAYGNSNGGDKKNLVSNTGVVSADAYVTGTARYGVAACSYGGDKGIFGYGNNYLNTTSLVSNTGVMSADVTGVGTARRYLAACSYGGNKGIFGYGANGSGAQSMTNLISSTGVVATDTTGVGTSRSELAACGYGGDKGIFGYGSTSALLSMTNKVSNTGVVSGDTAGVGTARTSLGACGYSLT